MAASTLIDGVEKIFTLLIFSLFLLGLPLLGISLVIIFTAEIYGGVQAARGFQCGDDPDCSLGFFRQSAGVQLVNFVVVSVILLGLGIIVFGITAYYLLRITATGYQWCLGSCGYPEREAEKCTS